MMDTRASASAPAVVVVVDDAAALALNAAADDETRRELRGNADGNEEDAEGRIGRPAADASEEVALEVGADEGMTNGMRRVDERCSSEKDLRDVLCACVCVCMCLNETIVMVSVRVCGRREVWRGQGKLCKLGR